MSSAAAGRREIPFFNYKGAFSEREPEYLAILSDIIRRGAFIQQRDLVDFEAHLAEYVGVRHAIGVGNATDGLIMVCRAAGIGPGDEVIFPSHTMVASAASVAHCGGIPVPVDIGPDHLIDPDAVRAAITPRTKAILPVHLNGRTCDMDAIRAIADAHGLVIIEDAAQALGSTFKGQHAGTFGVGAAISFYPAKILGCFGDGGAVITNDDEVARKLRLLRDHGRNDEGEVEMWGLNSRLDNFQAAVLDLQFRTYGDIIEHRRKVAARYEAELSPLAQLALPPGPADGGDHFDVFQNYEIEADDRDALREYLRENGVGTLIQWGGKPVHQFRGLGYDMSLPRTDSFFRRCLMLPMNMMVTEEDAGYVADWIRKFYGR